jgi:hypothetical protein
MRKPHEFPYFVGTWLTAEQKAKLQELAQCGRWTLSQSLRELVVACEVQPMVPTVQPAPAPASRLGPARSEGSNA